MKQIKRILALVVVLCIVLSVFAVSALAMNLEIKTTGSTHLRKGPGKGYKSIKTIAKGKVLSVTDYEFDSRNIVWYEVDYGSTSGWVSGKYIKATNLSDYDTVTSDHGSSYIRKTANKSGKKLAVVHKHDSVDFLHKASKDSRGMIWLKVDNGSKTGWISARYCELS